jgi:lysophospholipase L1-like esterase
MGTLTTGPSYIQSKWLNHEGHDGWRIDQIDAILNKSLASASLPPDLITIHLGTNDCYQGATQQLMNTRITSLLSHIQASVPNTTTTFIASILNFPRNAACVAAFNAGLPAVVAAHQATGMRLVYTPMQELSGLCTTTNPLTNLCCGHRMHPTAAGYLRMASAWALSIAENGTLISQKSVESGSF